MRARTSVGLASIFGTIFIAVILALAVWIREPTTFQYEVFRVILALAAAGVAAVMPGILDVRFGSWLTTGGALAIFLVVYFKSPARLAVQNVRSAEDIEIEKPIVHTARDATIKNEQAARDFDLNDVYNAVVIDGCNLAIPDQKVLIANDIQFLNGGSISGRNYSVVARTIQNGLITAAGKDAAAERSSVDGGRLFLYVKKMSNTTLSARGGRGANGERGKPGSNGKDGHNGKNGRCGPGMLNQFEGSTPGADGENGGQGTDGKNGSDGGDGGAILLTTVQYQPYINNNVLPGAGGAGGAGGPGGNAGRGGRGGSGCNGLGGSQPDRPNGKDGIPGTSGSPGVDGRSGQPGSYTVKYLKTFAPIEALVSNAPLPQGLHDRLQSLP